MLEINIDKIIERIKEHHNIRFDSEVAKLLNIKQNTLCYTKKRASIPWVPLCNYAKEYDINLNWLIYGEKQC